MRFHYGRGLGQVGRFHMFREYFGGDAVVPVETGVAL